jgi:nitroreductase
MQAIKERRSVRKYKLDPVSDEALNTVLEAARWAPSWANTQCWRFVVVRDSQTKEQLAGTLVSSQFPRNPATEGVKNAPIVIVACAKRGRSGYYKGEASTDKDDWYMYDIALAMQNLTLAAHAIGLGTVHIGLFDAKEMGRILSVPEGFEVVSLTPLGYPDETPKAPPRKDKADIVFQGKYGST